MSNARVSQSLLALVLATLCSPLALAQREIPFRMGIPVAPSGLADKPLADGPFDYSTGEGQNPPQQPTNGSRESGEARHLLPAWN